MSKRKAATHVAEDRVKAVRGCLKGMGGGCLAWLILGLIIFAVVKGCGG